jgi:hypothetical protein
MAGTATLLDRLEKLKAVRASGTLRVRVDEREVVFRNDRELEAQIAAIEAELNPQPRTVIVRSHKGWQ